MRRASRITLRTVSIHHAARLVPALLLATLVSCGHSPSSPRNFAPGIQQVAAEQTRLTPGGQTHLQCSAVDGNGDALSYDWRAGAGTVSGSGARVTLTAPSAAGSFQVSVTVTDGRGGESRDSVRVGVVPADAPVKAVVLRSKGTANPALWQYLDAHSSYFGGTSVSVDVQALAHVGLTYAELASTGAEVVIIDDARDAGQNEVFSTAEVAAIAQYVSEGHGLIVTGGTLQPNAHAPLIALLGLHASVGGQAFIGASRADSIVLAGHQAGLPTGLTSFTTQSRSFYSGEDWNLDGQYGDMADWASVVATPRAHIVAYIWNRHPAHAKPVASVISYVETRAYRAIFSGAGQSSDGSMTLDDLQFFYNSILYCAGL